jgi:hypothetical protein
LKKKSQKNSKIRQHEKTNPSLNSPSPFPLSNPFFAQTVAITIVNAIQPSDRQWACSLPSPPHPKQPQQRQWQRQFFMILQTSSGGCVQIISTSLR